MTSGSMVLESSKTRRRTKIPICPYCGVACTVCAPHYGAGKAKCCLIVAGKPE